MPLSSLKVVDVTQSISGPVVTALLSDLGADVVKIEQPGGEFLRGSHHELEGEPYNSNFQLYNRNKRSLCIDLKDEEGQQIVYELVEKADVFIQNWPPGVAERVGVDYATLSDVNESLIYAHITGFGQGGPLRDKTALDNIIQHISGFSSLMGYEDRPPIMAASPVADYYSGYNTLVAILAALYKRATSSEKIDGEKIEISMLESVMHGAQGAYEEYFNVGREVCYPGRNYFLNPERLMGAVEVQDGWICVTLTLYNERIWKGFCEVIERPGYLNDDRFETQEDRREHLAELTALFEEAIADYTADEAVALLTDHGIPAAKHNTISEATELDQVDHLDVFISVDHPYFGDLTLTDTPLSFLNSEAKIRSRAPLLGEHTRDVLTELEYSQTAIDHLEERGVIQSSSLSERG